MKISISALGRPLALTAVTALTFTLVGCSGSAEPAAAPEPAPSTSSTSSSVPPTVESSPTASPSASASASASPSDSPSAKAKGNDALLAAGRLGLREVSSGTVSSVESERNGWEVHVVTADGVEQQLKINAAGKRVVSGPTKDQADAEDRAENQQFAKADVDYRDAVKAVEREIDGGQINELSLDRDNGRTTWEADVSDGSQQRSVKINANNGRVVSNQIDD
jgi:uncharacterized membrane protein YkoI